MIGCFSTRIKSIKLNSNVRVIKMYLGACEAKLVFFQSIVEKVELFSITFNLILRLLRFHTKDFTIQSKTL